MIRLLVQAVKILSIVVLTVAIAGGSVWFFDYWMSESQSEMVGRPVTVEITEEDDGGSVAEKLTDAEVIRYGFYFEQRLRFGGGELKPGVYNLRVGMSVPEIIDRVTVPSEEPSGEEEAAAQGNTGQQSFSVTFIEGQRIEQNAPVVEEAGLQNGSADYLAAAQDVDRFRGSYSFLETVPEGASLEGFLFPSTYNIGEGAGAADVIHLQLSTFESTFTPEMREQADTLGLSIYEVVILASIVEREAQIPEERPIIAQVYLNRIAEGMVLNADPTLQYVVGTPEDWWPVLNTALLEQASGSPYNTYEVEGLPPTPVANPGFASIQAVLEPSGDSFLYFVTTGDGSGAHVFANTLEEHNANTCEQHPDWEQCQGGGAMPDNLIADRVRATVDAA